MRRRCDVGSTTEGPFDSPVCTPSTSSSRWAGVLSACVGVSAMASDTPASTAAASKGRQDELRGLFFAVSSAVTLVSILVYLLLGFVAKGMASVTLLAYRLAFLTALGAHLYRASYTVLPRLTSFSAAALKRELLASNAVLRALYCAIFALTRPTGLAWLPLAVHAAAQLGAFVVAKTRLGADPRVRGAYDKLQRALPQLLVMVSQLEVANAGVLLVAMFSSRAREVAKFAIYVNIFLRAAWHCNDDTIMKMRLPGSTSYYHRLTWALLDERARPILRAVPQVQSAVDRLAAWFRT